MPIGKRKLRIDEEDTDGAKYTVKLGKAPSDTVTVAVGGTSWTDLTKTPASLSLTTSNGGTAQDATGAHS